MTNSTSHSLCLYVILFVIVLRCWLFHSHSIKHRQEPATSIQMPQTLTDKFQK